VWRGRSERAGSWAEAGRKSLSLPKKPTVVFWGSGFLIFLFFANFLLDLDIIMMTSGFLMHAMFLTGIDKWVISCQLLLSPAFLTPIS
jgi:hypothetical protein